MALKEYRRKRDFRRTPEPAGHGRRARGHAFVVQKHAARRLHYDFRLELGGALKSWAVPKGPSLDPAVRSLAVHVEDHPLEYASFEGVIPQGQYGGGTVMVWDRGTWEPHGDAAKQYRAGKLNFRLRGEKLSGAWTLVRMGGRAGEDGKNWLLIKRRDKAARKTDILKQAPRSIATGREMRQIAADADRVWESKGSAANVRSSNSKMRRSRAGKPRRDVMAKGRRSKSASLLSPQEIAATDGARRAELPARFKPQLATLASEVPQGDEWLHEIKFDGYRLLAFCDHGRARLVTRNGNDWTERFEAIAAALGELPLKSAILDGEVVSLNEGGQSDFQSLQNLMKRGKDAALVLYLFDVPYLEGYDLTQTPLLERKRLLAKIVHSSAPNNDGEVRYSDHIQGQGPNVLAHACRHAMEGVVSKRADSIYEQRRATSWLKIKCLKRQEFVIGGYTKPSGSRVGFGALLLGYYEDGRLRYAGRVGTGFTHESLRQLSSELKKRRVDASPFADPLRGSQVRGVTWARPEMVGEVEFTEWTSDGMLRHPSFQGIREDKPAEQIVREVAKSPAKLQSSTKPAGRPTKNRRSDSSAPSATTTRGNSSVAGIAITHPDRVLYPEQGITKRQLAKFYDGISDWILPYVVNRPLTLVRCPSGRAGQCFFQKHLTDSLPDALRGVTIQEKGKRAKYIVLDDTAGLISLVQMGVLEIHPWLAPADDVERPDRVVFDLDPGPDVPWGQVIAAAREIRRAIEQHDMESFVQTSGGKGLHVVIPLRPGRKWDAVKEFARSLAVELASRQPESYVATASTAKRKGKIFIDYLRNSRGATSVSPYSTRARRGAPVAVPVRWNELGKVTSADQFTVVSLPRRLSALKKDPWDGFFTVRQTL